MNLNPLISILKSVLLPGRTGKIIFSICTLLIFSAIVISGCKKDENPPDVEPSDNLALDSIVPSKRVIETVEIMTLTAYARGQNLSYKWNANYGTLLSDDSASVQYWACFSCVGLNTIECAVSNEFGRISDTVMIRVKP